MSDHMSLGDGVGRGALCGAVIGFIVVASLVTVVGMIAGLEALDSIGLGAFAAVWGGPGFGALVGAVMVITRNEQVAAAVEAPASGDGYRPRTAGDIDR